jgi:2-iminobutanoate/2-iminopropanoate deaminase
MKAMKRSIFLLAALLGVWNTVAGQESSSSQKGENPKRRVAKTGASPNGLFSPAIISGDLVFVSGQIGIDSKTGQLAEGLEGQFEQVFKNLTSVLEAAGSSKEHILKATVFLLDMNDYNAMNELYRKQFKADPPARTAVQVAKLPRDARIEIEVVAVLK